MVLGKTVQTAKKGDPAVFSPLQCTSLKPKRPRERKNGKAENGKQKLLWDIKDRLPLFTCFKNFLYPVKIFEETPYPTRGIFPCNLLRAPLSFVHLCKCEVTGKILIRLEFRCALPLFRLPLIFPRHITGLPCWLCKR